jgi:hypothetical protein
MEKEDNGGADIYLTGNNPNQFHPEPIPGAPTTPPNQINRALQSLRDQLLVALGM